MKMRAIRAHNRIVKAMDQDAAKSNNINIKSKNGT